MQSCCLGVSLCHSSLFLEMSALANTEIILHFNLQLFLTCTQISTRSKGRLLKGDMRSLLSPDDSMLKSYQNAMAE